KGSTGNSTGNLYAMVEQTLDAIKSKYDETTMRNVVNARVSAIDLIEANVDRFAITCDFIRQPWVCFSEFEAQSPRINQEYENASACGLQAIKLSPNDAAFNIATGVRVENQAQFNPLKYVEQLAMAIVDENCAIYE